jgi:hypothetical protein
MAKGDDVPNQDWTKGQEYYYSVEPAAVVLVPIACFCNARAKAFGRTTGSFLSVVVPRSVSLLSTRTLQLCGAVFTFSLYNAYLVFGGRMSSIGIAVSR